MMKLKYFGLSILIAIIVMSFAGGCVKNSSGGAVGIFDNNPEGFAAAQDLGNSLWGIINEQGEWVIEPQFNSIGNFAKNGLAPASTTISDNTFYGYINTSGELVVEAKYDYCNDFGDNGLAIVTQGGSYGLIDENGTEILHPHLDYIGSFGENGLAPASKTENEKYLTGFINESGEWAIAPTFGGCQDFGGNGLAVVSDPDTWLFGLINEKGDWVVDPQFASIEIFAENGLAVASKQENEQYLSGFINGSGEWAIAPTFGGCQDFDDNGLAVVSDPDTWLFGLINEKGDWVVEPQFALIGTFAENGLAVASKLENDIYLSGFINESGEWIIAPTYDYCSDFGDNGLAVAKDSETMLGGIINEKGDWVVEPLFASISNFSENGLAVAVEQETGILYGVIDKNGEWVIEPQFRMLENYQYLPDGESFVTAINVTAENENDTYSEDALPDDFFVTQESETSDGRIEVILTGFNFPPGGVEKIVIPKKITRIDIGDLHQEYEKMGNYIKHDVNDPNRPTQIYYSDLSEDAKKVKEVRFEEGSNILEITDLVFPEIKVFRIPDTCETYTFCKMNEGMLIAGANTRYISDITTSILDITKSNFRFDVYFDPFENYGSESGIGVDYSNTDDSLDWSAIDVKTLFIVKDESEATAMALPDNPGLDQLPFLVQAGNGLQSGGRRALGSYLFPLNGEVSFKEYTDSLGNILYAYYNPITQFYYVDDDDADAAYMLVDGVWAKVWVNATHKMFAFPYYGQ